MASSPISGDEPLDFLPEEAGSLSPASGDASPAGSEAAASARRRGFEMSEAPLSGSDDDVDDFNRLQSQTPSEPLGFRPVSRVPLPLSPTRQRPDGETAARPRRPVGNALISAGITDPGSPHSGGAASQRYDYEQDGDQPQRPSGRRRHARGDLLVGEAGDGIDGGEADVVETKEIWGTTVSINETLLELSNFVRDYVDPAFGDDPLYPRLIEQAVAHETNSLNLNCEHLATFNPQLYDHMVRFPQEMTLLCDRVINDAAKAMFPDAEWLDVRSLQTRPYGLRQQRAMRDLNPNDIDQLVRVHGMIVRGSAILPEISRACFRCSSCHADEHSGIDHGKITEPTACSACHAQASMVLIHNMCLFTDKQAVKMQETPDAIPEGETPQTVMFYAYDSLVDVAKPGDRVEITGIFRAAPTRPSPMQRSVRAIYRTYLDALHIRKTDTGRISVEDSRSSRNSEYFTSFEDGQRLDTLDEDRQQQLKILSKKANIYDLLSESLAPGIWALEDVKKGLLLQLFGGTHKTIGNGGGSGAAAASDNSDSSGGGDGGQVRGYGAQTQRLRGDINVLLVGDPGTSKSQLLQYVHRIAPRGIYTSGKGSSAVGLTAYVSRDPDTKGAVLESGALVLSDRGVCCIDEFDKMSDHTRSVLHEAMEQQTISVAKAGIIATLNARTAVLAAANPRESRYNPRLPVVDNIQLPPTLLSRFDLIYLVLDKPDERTDTRLAKHLVSLYFPNPVVNTEGLSIQTLTQYISYAREHIHPNISDAAKTELVQAYVTMRKLGTSRKTITATPRQLESLIRLSEAHARMRFSDVVERRDVLEANRLITVALQQAAMDPRTGTIDMDVITTGRSATSRDNLVLLANELQILLDSREGTSWRFNQILAEMQAQSSVEISPGDLREVLHRIEGFDVVGDINKNPTILKRR